MSEGSNLSFSNVGVGEFEIVFRPFARNATHTTTAFTMFEAAGYLGYIFPTVIGVAWVFFMVSLFRSIFFFVQFGRVRIQTRFGKITKIARDGINWKLPFVDQFASRYWLMPIRENEEEALEEWITDIPIDEVRHDPKPASYHTKDSQIITVDLNYHSKITDPVKAIQCSDLWDGLETAVKLATTATCHSHSTETSIYGALPQGIHTNESVLAFCKEFGIVITRVEVQRVQANDDIIAARLETAKKLREHDLQMSQRASQATADEQRMKYESEANLRLHQKEVSAQVAATKLRQQRAEDEATCTLAAMRYKTQQHEAIATQQRAEWKLASEGIETEARNRLAIAKVETEATALKAGATTRALFDLVRGLPPKEQADVLNHYHISTAMQNNLSIRTVNFLAPGAHCPQLAYGMGSYPYGMLPPQSSSASVADDKK